MCRFLTRLLLVHGQLSTYRLSRLIKYSFYKNIAFAFLLFFFQFYNGFSGQVSPLGTQSKLCRPCTRLLAAPSWLAWLTAQAVLVCILMYCEGHVQSRV